MFGVLTQLLVMFRFSYFGHTRKFTIVIKFVFKIKSHKLKTFALNINQ